MERLYYLDYLRAFAMLVGIFVHVTTLGDFGVLEAVGTASHHFRMGTFFAVSGFFAGLLLTKRSLRAFFGSRLLALGLPLTFGLLVLNPLALWAVHAWRIGPTGFDRLGGIVAQSFDPANGIGTNFVWHLHLWFLIALIAYTLAASLLWRLVGPAGAGPVIGKAAQRLPDAVLALCVALVVAAAVVALRGVYSLTGKALGAPWIVLATLAYAPYYVLGLALFGQPRLWERLHRIDLPLIAVAASLWLVVELAPALPGGLGSVAGIVKRELTVCAVFFALLAVTRRLFPGPNRAWGFVSEGIYTAYLLHYLVIYCLALLLRPWLPEGSAIQFWLIAVLTAALTLGFHHLVVRRVPLLLLLLNERPASKGAVPVPPLGGPVR
ncbi:MAG: acyltransferase family protein [Gemmobacter sp.]